MRRRPGRILFLTLLASAAVGCSDEAIQSAPGDIVDRQIAVGDMLFEARTTGPEDGELVILLHGFPETSYAWIHQLPALGEAGYRTVAPDQRGYSPGARPPEVSDYEVGALVQDVLAIADALGAERFHLVGHDWGAGVAWGLAGLAPDRLLTLTTMSIPHPDAFNRELEDMTSCQYMASSYFDFFSSAAAEDFFLAADNTNLRALYEGVSKEAVEEYVRVLGSRPAMSAALNWYRANVMDRMFDVGDLGAISTPTLFVWSDMDSAVCPEPAAATEQFVSGPYQFEILEGVNHWIPEVAPDATTALLLDHFGG
jgi:pimeloyl-ACP methyl ester carboxylesterase